ncbi:Fe-S cluster assembly protein SufD [bacterium]|nr:Fe-S cluster assembly protein SufD [bacterium]
MTAARPAEIFAARYAALPSDPRRARAWEAFSARGLPSRRHEGWRWTDVAAALDRQARLAPPEAHEVQSLADPFEALGGGVFRFTGDRFTPPRSRPAGVLWRERADAPALNGAEATPLAALAVALSSGPASVEIEVAASPVEPLRLVFDDQGGVMHRHVLVMVREGVELDVLETHLGRVTSNVVVEYIVEDGARLSRSIIQSANDRAVQAAHANIWLARAAALNQACVATGALLSRIETRLVHRSGGSHARMNAVYLVRSGRHCDLTSHVRHDAEGCTTEQLVKGAARAGGKGVFQGKFHVTRSAQKTDAKMTHHALLLDDGAEVNAKPELEIYADDVACAHGNTCGSLDPAALFYCRQRGLPEAVAVAMLTDSFLREALSGAPPSAEPALAAELAAWLGTGE